MVLLYTTDSVVSITVLRLFACKESPHSEIRPQRFHWRWSAVNTYQEPIRNDANIPSMALFGRFFRRPSFPQRCSRSTKSESVVRYLISSYHLATSVYQVILP